MLEIKCVGDKLWMLVTSHVTNIESWAPTSNISHKHHILAYYDVGDRCKSPVKLKNGSSIGTSIVEAVYQNDGYKKKRVEKIIISLTLYISLFNPFSAQY